MSANVENVVSHARKGEFVLFGALMLAFVFGIGLDVSDQPTYERYKAWALALWGLALLGCLLRPVTRCAASGWKAVWSVVAVGALALIVTLVIFYTCYFWVGPTSASAEKLLNLPPLIGALWVAGTGWYIHFQATAKNHRTTNAFNLIMQTRTCKEFLERGKQVQLAYPHGSKVPVADEHYFHQSALKDAHVASGGDEAHSEMKKAVGADSLKYLLNYYEFMAVGIEARDLEEDLLYDTIGVTVTSIHERSEVFINFIRDPAKGNQPLAFSCLSELCERWNKRLRAEVHALQNP